jgi:GNAT superfamily N-acetyltransferase
MAQYVFREAVVADIPRLSELLIRMDAHVAGTPRAALQPTAAGQRDIESRLESLIGNRFVHFVVVEGRGGSVVAMGNLQVWHYPDYWRNEERRGRVVGVIDDVWVEPRHRRRGINRRIVQELLNFADLHGVQELVLEYALTNREAEAAWTRLGFSPIGVRASATPAGVRAALVGSEPDSDDRESAS